MLGLLKFGWLIPGGQIGALIGAVLNAVATFVRWVVEDVVDIFTKPKRFALAAVLVVAGAWLSADFYREKLKDLKSDIAKVTEALEAETQTNAKWQARYQDEEKLRIAAEHARANAEQQILQAAAEADARKRATAARRVRDQQSGPVQKAAGPEEPAQPSLWGIPKLFQGADK